MSDINKLIMEALDITGGTLGGSITGNLGSFIGTHYSTKGMTNLKDKRKAEFLARLSGFAGAVGAATSLSRSLGSEYSTPGFIAGAGIGSLIASGVGGKVARHMIERKYQRI